MVVVSHISYINWIIKKFDLIVNVVENNEVDSLSNILNEKLFKV